MLAIRDGGVVQTGVPDSDGWEREQVLLLSKW